MLCINPECFWIRTWLISQRFDWYHARFFVNYFLCPNLRYSTLILELTMDFSLTRNGIKYAMHSWLKIFFHKMNISQRNAALILLSCHLHEVTQPSQEILRTTVAITFWQFRISDCKSSLKRVKYLQCKWVLHLAHSPDLTITDFNLFGNIKEEIRTMEISSGKEVLDAVIDILKRIF
jgi:hypothetical protein